MSKVFEAKVTCMYCGREFLNADFASALSDVEYLRAHVVNLENSLTKQDAVIEAARKIAKHRNWFECEVLAICDAVDALDSTK